MRAIQMTEKTNFYKREKEVAKAKEVLYIDRS